MNCPVCGGSTIVFGSERDCEGVYRYRKCKECAHTFFTSELESDAADFRRLRAETKRNERERKRLKHEESRI